MKTNERRKVFDAVDLLTEETAVSVPAVKIRNGMTMLSIDSIKPFHDHPFHLYEGDRLDDMIESVRVHGVLNPVIVRTTEEGYEMLSGHNRQNAARLAGLTEIPAIIKKDLPDEDAYVYVIETNLMQRSFSDLEISEKAAVLKERYDKVLYQRHRGKIMEEVARRLLKVNDLIKPLRNKLDNHSLDFKAGIQISFLTEEEQQMVYEEMMDLHVKPTVNMVIKMRGHSGELTRAMVRRYLTKTVEPKDKPLNIKVPEKISKKYFAGKEAKDIEDILNKALEAWFAGEGGADV